MTHGTISSAIFSTDFPILVPPNFCTNQLVEGSIVFWCRLGGVGGLESDTVEVSERVSGEAGGVGSKELLNDIVRFYCSHRVSL